MTGLRISSSFFTCWSGLIRTKFWMKEIKTCSLCVLGLGTDLERCLCKGMEIRVGGVGVFLRDWLGSSRALSSLVWFQAAAYIYIFIYLFIFCYILFSVIPVEKTSARCGGAAGLTSCAASVFLFVRLFGVFFFFSPCTFPISSCFDRGLSQR